MNGNKNNTTSQFKLKNMRNLNVQPTTEGTRGVKKFWETGPSADFIMAPDDERKFSRQPDMSLQMQELFEEFNKIHLIKTGQSLPTKSKGNGGAVSGFLKPNSSPNIGSDREKEKEKLPQRPSWQELPDIWSDTNPPQTANLTPPHRPLALSKSLEVSPSKGILKKPLTLSKSWNDVTNTQKSRKLSADSKNLSDSSDAISPSVYRRYKPKSVEILSNKTNNKKLLHRTRHTSYDKSPKVTLFTPTHNLLTVPPLPPVPKNSSNDKLKTDKHVTIKRTKSDTR